MGFKVDASFLRYLTMGATGAHHVVGELRKLGFQPIELERYATSNKIWATKVKRLRLPDVLCVQTGLRIEIRAKSSLEIRMSHAPNNPDRHWDTGLRDKDVVAIVVCSDDQGKPTICGSPSYFSVAALRHSVDTKQLSRLKAASEGSEQHLAWPTIVSNRPGRVLGIDKGRLNVEWSGDGIPARRYGYALRGKVPYVQVGGKFPANTVILAGTPAKTANLRPYLRQRFRPIDALKSRVAVDRYAGAKAIPFRPDLHRAAKQVLGELVGKEVDSRIGLEIAHSAAALGLRTGADLIHKTIWESNEAPMRMEAIFILTELGKNCQATFVADELSRVARNVDRFAGDEARQAAVWGLGHAGVRAYDRLLPFLADADRDLALHAIAAFGTDTPAKVVRALVTSILADDSERAAAASEALRMIGGVEVLTQLIEAAQGSHANRPWIVATLGRLPVFDVRKRLAGTTLLTELEPFLLTSPTGAWIFQEDASTSLRFIQKQCLSSSFSR